MSIITLKDRMIEALTRTNVDTKGAVVSRDSEGFWVVTVGDVTLRARRGAVEAFIGDKTGRGSDRGALTDVHTMQKTVQSAIHRRELARNLIKDIQKWTRLAAWSPGVEYAGGDILVASTEGGDPSVKVYFNGRYDSVIALPVEGDESESQRKISALIHTIADFND